jgi:hypothetical protein
MPSAPHDVAALHDVVAVPPGLAQYSESCDAAPSQLAHPAHVNVCPSLVLYAIDAHDPPGPSVVHSSYVTPPPPQATFDEHVAPAPASPPLLAPPLLLLAPPLLLPESAAHAWLACVAAAEQSLHALQ